MSTDVRTILFMVDWLIYTLKDPVNLAIRYVGYTTKSVQHRLKSHLHEAKRHQRDRRTKWLFSLLRNNLEPIYEIIQTGHGNGWREAEIFWIAHHRAAGCDLVNGTNGGDGVLGGWGTHEERSAAAKRSMASRTPEQRRAGALAMLAATTPEQRRENSRKAARSMSPEKQRRNGIIGAKYLAEENAKSTPEIRSQRMKRSWATKSIDDRREAARRLNASLTLEQRRLNGIKVMESRSTEERREFGRIGRMAADPANIAASRTHEERSDSAKSWYARTTAEWRAERARNMVAARWSKATPEMRAAATENARKARKKKTLTRNGETKTMREWSDLLGIKYELIAQRLSRGWTDEQALSGKR
ncbi:MAG: GIY-YIG nuclease family protein [Acidobacteriota bacterium]